MLIVVKVNKECGMWIGGLLFLFKNWVVIKFKVEL